MQARDGVVEAAQALGGQVDRARVVHDVELGAHHDADAKVCLSDDLEIAEIHLSAASLHRRTVLGEPDELEAALLCDRDHLAHGAVGMAARNRMHVDIENIFHFDSILPAVLLCSPCSIGQSGLYRKHDASF